MIAARSRAAALAALGTLLVSVSGAGCGGSKQGGSSGTKVAVADFRFAPKEIDVKAGQTVTWTNGGSTTHNLKGPGFFSQALDPGKSYSHEFRTKGRINYLCTLHPTLMQGVVVVR